MNQDRNTLLKLNSTGEYIAWNETDGYHLTMDRTFARPFTEDEIEEQQTRLAQKLDREDWLVQLWKEENRNCECAPDDSDFRKNYAGMECSVCTKIIVE